MRAIGWAVVASACACAALGACGGGKKDASDMVPPVSLQSIFDDFRRPGADDKALLDRYQHVVVRFTVATAVRDARGELTVTSALRGGARAELVFSPHRAAEVPDSATVPGATLIVRCDVGGAYEQGLSLLCGVP